MALDFNMFPVMEKGYFVCPEPNTQLKEYQDVYSRFCSSIYFANCIGSDRSLYFTNVNDLRTAYFRSSLAEFISIDELIKRKYSEKYNECSLVKSSNPLFHSLKLIRNYNIHFDNSRLNSDEKRVSHINYPEQSFELEFFFIDNLDIAEICKLDAVSKQNHYTQEQVSKMISHFELEQRKFGVSDLITRAIIDYSNIVATRFSNFK